MARSPKRYARSPSNATSAAPIFIAGAATSRPNGSAKQEAGRRRSVPGKTSQWRPPLTHRSLLLLVIPQGGKSFLHLRGQVVLVPPSRSELTDLLRRRRGRRRSRRKRRNHGGYRGCWRERRRQTSLSIPPLLSRQVLGWPLLPGARWTSFHRHRNPLLRLKSLKIGDRGLRLVIAQGLRQRSRSLVATFPRKIMTTPVSRRRI